MSQSHLHLDLSLGARAEMWIGALLALGAPRAAALDALGAVGLSSVGLQEERVWRGALKATAARLQIPGEERAAPLELRTPSRGPRRARPGAGVAPVRRAAVRHASAKPAVAEPAALPVPGALVLPAATSAPPTPRLVDGWRAGAAARVLDLPAQLLAAELSPVVKALAHKAARRLAHALVEVAGAEARLTGPCAVRTVAELVAVCALVDALAPASITATPVAVSMAAARPEGVVDDEAGPWLAPSPWVLEILAGAPLVENDRPWVCVDPAGAACAWALVHRFGARGVTGFSRQGLGAADLDAPRGSLVTRALLGPPVPLATRRGDRSAEPVLLLDASVPAEAVTPALLEELRAQGALEVRAQPELVVLGAPPRVALGAAVAAGAAEALCEQLWQAGAVDVTRTWADRWTPGPAEVTRRSGRGTTVAAVQAQADEDGEGDDHGR